MILMSNDRSFMVNTKSEHFGGIYFVPTELRCYEYAMKIIINEVGFFQGIFTEEEVNDFWSSYNYYETKWDGQFFGWMKKQETFKIPTPKATT